MYLIYNIDLVFARLRGIPYLVGQVPDIVDGVVGSRVELVNIDRSIVLKADARLTLAAGLDIVRQVEAIGSFGQYPGACSLAHPPGATEKERLGQVIGRNRVF